eukprot:Em0007g62a
MSTMKQADPAGFDVIREHYRHISSTTDPTTLAGCMFEANLIEFELLNDSCREERPATSRVQALVNALLGNGEEGAFQKFVEKLCEEKLWWELGGTLRDAYIKKGGHWKDAGKGGGGGGNGKPADQTGTSPTPPDVPPSPARATPPDDSCQWCALEQLFSHGCPAPAPAPQGDKGGDMGRRGSQCRSATPHWVGGADTAGIVQGFASLKQTLRDCVEKMVTLDALKEAVLGISGAPLHNVAMFGDHAHIVQRCSAHSEVLDVVHRYTPRGRGTRLCKSLNLPPYALRMCMVCGACGGVVYCIPSGVYREVFKTPLTPELLREASLVGMTELTVVGASDPTRPSRGQAKQQCVLLCHTLWGPQLSYNPYQYGDPLVRFDALWPDLQRMISIYQDARLVECGYELCKLLLASASFRCLEGLLERKVLREDQVFKEAGTVTLGNLVKALGPHSVPAPLAVRDNGGKGRKPSAPNSSSVRDEIFLHATQQPEMFYTLVMELQNNSFDVNSEKRLSCATLLIHVGGQTRSRVSSSHVRTHPYLQGQHRRSQHQGHTPLCLAAQLGDENMMEVMWRCRGDLCDVDDEGEGRSM